MAARLLQEKERPGLPRWSCHQEEEETTKRAEIFSAKGLGTQSGNVPTVFVSRFAATGQRQRCWRCAQVVNRQPGFLSAEAVTAVTGW